MLFSLISININSVSIVYLDLCQVMGHVGIFQVFRVVTAAIAGCEDGRLRDRPFPPLLVTPLCAHQCRDSAGSEATGALSRWRAFASSSIIFLEGWRRSTPCT